MRTGVVLAAAMLFSCHTGSSNTVAGALIMTPLAIGASALSRAQGGCYAVCQQPHKPRQVALVGAAPWLVTVDRRHLLSLGRFAGVRLVGPVAFLAETTDR
jgi:hypothetical protein